MLRYKNSLLERILLEKGIVLFPWLLVSVTGHTLLSTEAHATLPQSWARLTRISS